MLSRAARLARPALRARRAFCSTPSAAAAKFSLPDLPYDYAALEPHISGEIMEIHHSKHHNTYVANLNVAMEKLEAAEASNDVAEQIALQGAIKFNGGGHVNHSIFWTNLAPAGSGGGGAPSGELADRISSQWGDFESFKAEFAATTVGFGGRGWSREGGWGALVVTGLTFVLPSTSSFDFCLCPPAPPPAPGRGPGLGLGMARIRQGL